MLPNFPFSIVYRVHQDAMQVVAVAHHRRRPGYWRDRNPSPKESLNRTPEPSAFPFSVLGGGACVPQSHPVAELPNA